MKTLNLTDLEKSEIKYKISKFPDGQQNIIIIDYKELDDEGCWFNLIENQSIQIKSRLNNWLDLELIVCAVASLRELGVEEIHLYTPYIIGARSDRKFEEGSNNYLKDVICPIINSLGFKSVTCIDPHSDVLEACIKRFKKESNYKLVAHFAIGGIIRNMNLPARLKDEYHKSPQGLYWDKRGFDNLLLIAPDGGASKKIYKLAEQIGYKGDIITCSKNRDSDGNLTRIEFPFPDEAINNQKDFIIIDDICDGGATFINIAKEIKRYFNHEEFDGYQPKIYLIVTHGIFSKGFDELNKYFDGIYTTNSVRNVGEYEHNGMNLIKTNVKQINVFI